MRLLLGLVLACVLAACAVLYSAPTEQTVASYVTSIEGRTKSQRYNAARALSKLNGVMIQPHQNFSFNARVGSFARDDGYRKAPVSYNGQLIDSWGGGVCQASTTVYNAALIAGMRIEERHRHEFCPSYVPPGRDAAVAYGDIDLKFRNPYSFPVRILASADNAMLKVRFVANSPLPKAVQVTADVRNIEKPTEFLIGAPGQTGRVRNTGKPGYDVAVYRLVGEQRELISFDSYPAMNRVVQYGD